jgi:acyl carrier protein
MTNEEIIGKIEEALELDENSIDESTELESLPEYDSMGKLSLIVLCDDDFEKKLSGEQIKLFKTVKDIVDFLK